MAHLPDAAEFARQWEQVKAIARAAGRDPAQLSAAMYLTLTVDDDADRAAARMDAFLEGYYGAPPAVLNDALEEIGALLLPVDAGKRLGQ